RLPIALAIVGAGWVLAEALLPDTRAWSAGRVLVPLVFGLTVVLEWAADLDTEEGVLHAVLGKLQELWESSGAGFYGAVAAATFLRAEVSTFVQEWNEAGSLVAFVKSELLETVMGFSLASLMNLLEAAIWFVGWLSFPLAHAAALLAGTFAAYALGRWAWPDPDEDDRLETAIEGLTRRT
ncbi:MAG: hypothetical protein KC656_34385, partial [Myxococcales bacterium]|nr:hypothetical protein [Myxococcales bacterium]